MPVTAQPAKYLAGDRRGHWTVVGSGQWTRHGWYYNCHCVCGAMRLVRQYRLDIGGDISCGCVAYATRVPPARTHGATGTKLYRAWKNIKTRCLNSRSRAFAYYGGRGIGIHPEWSESFAAFAAGVGAPSNPSATVDRVNNDRGYEPGNVRWATRLAQVRNRRNTVRVTAFGQTRPLAEWAEGADVSAGAISARIKSGWDPQFAICAPKGF